MSDFPPLGMSIKEDASQYDFEQKDNTKAANTEAGYKFTRPRSTRRPRRIFTTGFTDINEADRTLLRDFYDSVKGGAAIFTWTDPTDGTEYSVRFVGNMKYDYVGMSYTRRYNVHNIKLEEV